MNKISTYLSLEILASRQQTPDRFLQYMHVWTGLYPKYSMHNDLRGRCGDEWPDQATCNRTGFSYYPPASTGSEAPGEMGRTRTRMSTAHGGK
jgi:hypothetical protein